MKNLYWASLICLILSSCATTSGNDRKDLYNEYLGLADSYMELEKYDKALELYEKGLAYYDNPALNANIVIAAINVKDYKKAELYLKTYKDPQTSSNKYRELKAFLALAREDYEAAGKLYAEIQKTDPSYPSALDNLILIAEKTENRGDYRTYLLLKWKLEQSKEDFVKLMDIYLEDEMWNDMEKVLLDAPDSVTPESSLYWANLYIERGLYNEALLAYDLYLGSGGEDSGPSFSDILFKFDLLFLKMKKYDQAYELTLENRELFLKNRSSFNRYVEENDLGEDEVILRINKNLYDAE